MARLGFALWVLQARFKSKHNHCPYCGSIFSKYLQHKRLLIEARKCQYCNLIFRWPTDDPERAKQYYEKDYDGGIITDLPSLEEILKLRNSNFKQSVYDRTIYVDLVQAIVPPPAKVLDFGGSWGYVGFQLQQAGYQVEGFELSEPRAEFGRTQLDQTLHSSWEQLSRPSLPRFDVVLTAHALEHVYDLRSTLNQLARTLVPEGFLIIIVPNGGGREARQRGVAWKPHVGEAHTIAFTTEWFRQNLYRHGFEVIDLFSPDPAGKDRSCDGDELICVAQYSNASLN